MTKIVRGSVSPDILNCKSRYFGSGRCPRDVYGQVSPSMKITIEDAMGLDDVYHEVFHITTESVYGMHDITCLDATSIVNQFLKCHWAGYHHDES